VRDLSALAPQTVRLLRGSQEVVVPVSQVKPGEIAVVRPGEKIPVDGQVVDGLAVVNQATITGEAMPIDAGPGSYVYAATLIMQGSLRVRTEQVGPGTTFGRVIKLVEDAEAHRADVQMIADKFSAYYLPVVIGLAALTYLFRRDPMATVAVLVVACSCSFALATPIAMLASIGAGAQRGLLIKGGKYLESLAQADVLLIDKTGTLTLGKPRIEDCILLGPVSHSDGICRKEPDGSINESNHRKMEILHLAATAERYSEHPLAEALREKARDEHLSLEEPIDFESLPGMGVKARVDGKTVLVGNRRVMETLVSSSTDLGEIQRNYQSDGKSLIYTALEGEIIGLFMAVDTLRPEVPKALSELYSLGIRPIEILTGDNPQTAHLLIQSLGQEGDKIQVRANLLPEDKIRIVSEYQQRGHVVAMVGDGVNDAPALAQADVGIALRSAGAGGSDLAVEAAHIALMRDDWRLIPGVIRIARRTMGVVKMNIWFTAVYNLLGLSLAALGFLPPVFAAAAQSLPDLGIMANSSRLLRQKD
jgi:P-type Cu+ transporter